MLQLESKNIDSSRDDTESRNTTSAIRSEAVTFSAEHEVLKGEMMEVMNKLNEAERYIFTVEGERNNAIADAEKLFQESNELREKIAELEGQ